MCPVFGVQFKREVYFLLHCLFQICELGWQLRGEAGARQVPGARVGLTHTVGGGVTKLEAGASAVMIFTAV